MTFRRPRVNVKPNVQSGRPVSSTIRPSEAPNESASASQDELPTEPSETPVSLPPAPEPLPAIEESIPTIEETIKTPSPAPTTELPPLVSAPIVAPASPPASVPSPLPTPAPLPTRPMIRRRIAPNIGMKSSIHHRRPSASCSGTESETESSRQKHSTASSISFTRVVQPSIKPTISTETSLNLTSVIPAADVLLSSPSKLEALANETTESPASVIDINPHHLPSRSNLKISHDYLRQHINYRAQRLASKVEADKTIRKRRAATLGKIDKSNANNDGPVDASKLTIADFVHYNPVDNPMEARAKPTTITNGATSDSVRKQSVSSHDGQNAPLAPQLKIDANGKLILDEESLYIRNADEAPRSTMIVEGRFNDDNLTHQSYRKIGRRKRWNNRDTLRFYQALRMCGTDFTLIANVFPNRDRDDIKRKFKTEDKANRTLIDSALSQRIPFDLTCFYSPSEDSSDEENPSDTETLTQRKTRKRRKPKAKPTSSSDPLEINRRREKRLQSRKNSTRTKKSAEFIDDDDDDDQEEDEGHSMDVADTVEVMTSKCEQSIPSTQDEVDPLDNSGISNMAELESLIGRIDGGHLLFVHNTDENTGLDRIDVHVVVPTGSDNPQEQSIAL